MPRKLNFTVKLRIIYQIFPTEKLFIYVFCIFASNKTQGSMKNL